MPLVGDFHFNGHRLLAAYPERAEALGKCRINPGDVGKGVKHDEQFCSMIEVACRYDKPVRLGVNWASLDSDLLARMNEKVPGFDIAYTPVNFCLMPLLGELGPQIPRVGVKP